MAELHPFRAWRYNPKRVPNLQAAVAPLADAQPPEVFAALRARSTSAIHLMHPTSPEDARQRLQQWLQHQVLVPDDFPAIYPYYQDFQLFGEGTPRQRKGFLALINLANNDIRTHEDVLPAKVESRLPLLEALRLQTIPTHGLYQDPQHELETILDGNRSYPLAQITDSDGVRHTLYRMTDQRLMTSFREIVARNKVYLADGHHRLAAHLRWWQNQQPGSIEHEKGRWHLMFLSNLMANDLYIFPFHRVVDLPEDLSLQTLETGLNERFVLQDLPAKVPVYQVLDQHPDAMVLVWPHKAQLLKPRNPDALAQEMNLPEPPAVRRLAYTWVHYWVFDRLLGWPYARQPSLPHIYYVRHTPAAIKMAQQHPHRLAVLLNPVKPSQLVDVCESGAHMPAKSTYFFPKVLGGLAFCPLVDS